MKGSGPKTKLAARRFRDSVTEPRGTKTKLGASCSFREYKTQEPGPGNKAKRFEDRERSETFLISREESYVG
jgi:hypothetical protein